MPVDPSRRSSRKPTNDDETDVRRARGEVHHYCAECRRLKLKCDKKLPCSSCIRRGCPSICPNGSLSSQGTRFVLASTDHLHTKIGEMGQRIRQLEDALAIFQAVNGSHPLLRDELLSIKFGPEKGAVPEKQIKSKEPSMDSGIDALGTLTIGDDGENKFGKYFGPSAGSEAGAEMEMSSNDFPEFPPLSVEIARLSNSFPFSAGGPPGRGLDLLFDCLPEQPRAWALCETYLEQCAWQFRPIAREEMVEDFIIPIYKSLRERRSWNSDADFPHTISPHKMAVLFLFFSLGALVDLTLEPHNAESDRFYHASRAAMALRSVFDSPEMATVQAVLLMATYHNMGGRSYTMESSWSLMCLGSKRVFLLLAELSLDRDSARWNMDPKTVNRRRFLFWELFSAELFQSIALGRPPSIRLSYVDCDLQRTETVLELDRLVRAKTLPAYLNVFLGREDENCTPSVYMRGCLLGQVQVPLLYIHRTFFAQAMLDHPVNPLRSPYAPSFLAAYRCASGMIKANLNHFERFPELCCRWWVVWTHCCIVTRSPSSSMAPTAFIELGLACDLFEKGAKFSRRARSGLAILGKLREKAFQVYSQFRSGNPTPPPVSGFGPGLFDYGEDELALFGGQTRVLVSRLISRKDKDKNKDQTSKESYGPSASSTSTSVSSPSTLSETVPDVHPSLVEYLSLFPPSQHPSPQSQDGQQAGEVYQPELMGQSAPVSSTAYGYDQTFFDELSLPAPQYYVDPDTPPKDIADLGMLMSGDSGIDEQWKAFMKKSFSGLLDAHMP
ncbi:hypothetical protein B0H14DRAFT_3079297 [Mycena olivaceomarginata]|nr:hypothetical protein B0H14DRAFT_3079297 [Mycena olivaceomarginata]